MTEPATDRRPRADFWSGLVLAAIGLAFAVASWRMPRLEERGIDPLTVPGIVPGVLGLALLLLGLVLAFRGPGAGRPRLGLASITGNRAESIRLALALALNLAFALILVGRLPFWLATVIYLAVFMAVFWVEPRRAGWPLRAALILAVAAGTTIGIVYLFETLFLVRLP